MCNRISRPISRNELKSAIVYSHHRMPEDEVCAMLEAAFDKFPFSYWIVDSKYYIAVTCEAPADYRMQEALQSLLVGWELSVLWCAPADVRSTLLTLAMDNRWQLFRDDGTRVCNLYSCMEKLLRDVDLSL